jgi:hypothetical protein
MKLMIHEKSGRYWLDRGIISWHKRSHVTEETSPSFETIPILESLLPVPQRVSRQAFIPTRGLSHG